MDKRDIRYKNYVQILNEEVLLEKAVGESSDAVLTDRTCLTINAIAVDSGIVCDGAKASCAAKIASAVDAGILGVTMYNEGDQFFGGDGLLKSGVEKTIAIVGRLARFGMKETDEEIIRLMMEE